MNLLLDSHILIWALFEPDRLGKQTRRHIAQADEVFLSLTSIWELAIKHSKGKLLYSPDELLDGLKPLGVSLLAIKPNHILGLQYIQTTHQDPFDRLLLAQARAEGLKLITADGALANLGLSFVEAD